MSKKWKLEDGLANLFSSGASKDDTGPDASAEVAVEQSKPDRPPEKKQKAAVKNDEKKTRKKVQEARPEPDETNPEQSPVEEKQPVKAKTAVVEKVKAAPKKKVDKQVPEAAPEVEEKAPQAKAQKTAVSSVKELYQPAAEGEVELEEAAVELDIERYVIFVLGETTFGVDVNSVLTIIKVLPICPIPHSEDYLSGLVNLRGQIIPVLDLGKRIGLPDHSETEDSRIVVVEQEKRLFGFMVDYVRAVEQIQVDRIKEPSKMMTNVRNEYLSGIAETENGLILLLALDRLLQR